MSRLGKKSILLPKGVEVKGTQGEIEAKGPKGVSKLSLPPGISLRIEDNILFVDFDQASGLAKAMYGLYRSLVNNTITGISEGFEKHLSLVGVGYRAAVKGDVLDLQLGFSHPCQVKIPSEVKVTVEKSILVKVSGIDKQIVGQFCATVRAMRPPEPYKGKGIRYVDEYVRKKAGKAAKGK